MSKVYSYNLLVMLVLVLMLSLGCLKNTIRVSGKPQNVSLVMDSDFYCLNGNKLLYHKCIELDSFLSVLGGADVRYIYNQKDSDNYYYFTETGIETKGYVELSCIGELFIFLKKK